MGGGSGPGGALGGGGTSIGWGPGSGRSAGIGLGSGGSIEGSIDGVPPPGSPVGPVDPRGPTGKECFEACVGRISSNMRTRKTGEDVLKERAL